MEALLGHRALRTLITGAEMHAPATIDAEFLHGLRRAVIAGHIHAEDATYAIDMFSEISIHRYWVKPFVRRMWSLRHNITAYDAGYVALAESLGYPLLTRDRRLSQSAGHSARIEYID